MHIPLTMFLEHVAQQYQLREKEKSGFIYVEIRKAKYGLPQAGVLAKKLLKKRREPAGYYDMPHTPGLWKHVTRPVAFTLVVDDFCVKYVNNNNSDHLVAALKGKYKISEDWTGSLYCGIDLRWNYTNRTLDLGTPGYIQTQLQRYKHKKPTRLQHSPHPVAPRRYGKSAQHPIPPDETPAAGSTVSSASNRLWAASYITHKRSI